MANLGDKVAEKMEEDLNLGYDVWRIDPLDIARSFVSDYPEEFKGCFIADIRNAVRTWRRENAYRYYEDTY